MQVTVWYCDSIIIMIILQDNVYNASILRLHKDFLVIIASYFQIIYC